MFQVLGLLEGRFYYYYVTKEINTGQEVHALASYEYETERYKSLYENKVDPGAAGTDTDSQYSFYGHLAADKLGRLRISLYDGGNLFILDGEGKVVFSRTSEDEGEDFLYLIDSIFGVGGTNPSYFSKDITNVTTNGRYCFYVPITLYKGDYTIGRFEVVSYAPNVAVLINDFLSGIFPDGNEDLQIFEANFVSVPEFTDRRLHVLLSDEKVQGVETNLHIFDVFFNLVEVTEKPEGGIGLFQLGKKSLKINFTHTASTNRRLLIS